ncbi:hypothetical protein ACE1GL_003845 [Vibrio cholerae]|nr:hypothetical protein [Vibrio cholerae]EJF7195993.1 hypothetical protein [Vibrio cholerae]EJL6682590.1 hypothetical protein [Vibrio cholerae]EJL6697587.1 hypothetical protein [Vibrio cholerae]EJL6917104.1 hypothetical protein [Vibrio cholerae]
MGEFGIVREAR